MHANSVSERELSRSNQTYCTARLTATAKFTYPSRMTSTAEYRSRCRSLWYSAGFLIGIGRVYPIVLRVRISWNAHFQVPSTSLLCFKVSKNQKRTKGDYKSMLTTLILGKGTCLGRSSCVLLFEPKEPNNSNSASFLSRRWLRAFKVARRALVYTGNWGYVSCGAIMATQLEGTHPQLS